ncbi:hypothetical protein PG991_011042 [Apiospora marii]|uniref:Uncharacterized protein n=1 Tax=Apiospora marii TaxID=335849 RepID=A0ABR1RF20_9PEZI
MYFNSFASVIVVAAAAFVHAGPISDATAADGAGSLLLTAREPKCQRHDVLRLLGLLLDKTSKRYGYLPTAWEKAWDRNT